jgi:putative hydroxymethylpyrimidine transport system ATP-binding protein
LNDANLLSASPYAPGLSVRNARLGWNGLELLSGLSFDAPARAWTCLLGESGVGKSTLLRTLAGLIEPLDGVDIWAKGATNTSNSVAYMAQQDLLLPWLTAADNVALGARLRGETPDSAKISDILERTGMTDRADARPRELSGGERQRIALARTLMENRPIVLMDEPFSALDAITRAQLQQLAFELLGARTVVMVTHDPFEALRLGSKIHVVRKGDNSGAVPFSPPGTALRDPTDPSLRATYHAIMVALDTPKTPENAGNAAA